MKCCLNEPFFFCFFAHRSLWPSWCRGCCVSFLLWPTFSHRRRTSTVSTRAQTHVRASSQPLRGSKSPIPVSVSNNFCPPFSLRIFGRRQVQNLNCHPPLSADRSGLTGKILSFGSVSAHSHSPVGYAHRDGRRRDRHDERCGGQHHRIHWGLLCLCTPVLCSSASHPRHQQVIALISALSGGVKDVFLNRDNILSFLQRDFCWGHFLRSGWTFRNRKWLHLLQPQYRCSGNHKGNPCSLRSSFSSWNVEDPGKSPPCMSTGHLIDFKISSCPAGRPNTDIIINVLKKGFGLKKKISMKRIKLSNFLKN